ncbi:MAG: aldo/keto reductase [Sphingobacteriales bacterium]|nr:aldo/keto reductase [Sphingobacteriales bacterium]OJY91024.1 MAG: aldo/keto reductase [Sphingobacteriales bacterium 44-15]
MQKRFLGNTGIRVSEIAFGGVEIGMPYGIGVNGREDMIAEKDAIALLQAAAAKGFNFFDTARMYGVSENIMGKAFRHCRQDIVLATKCRHFRNAEGVLSSDAEIKKLIHTSIRESLSALQTDYIDVYMLHQADKEILDRQVIADEMLRLKKAGVVRAIGASTYSVEETRKAIESDTWNVVQLPFNLMDQRQQTLFELAAKSGVGIVVRSVLLKGLLSTRGTGLHPALQQVEEHIRKYSRLLQNGVSLPKMAVKFALSFPQVSSVLVGIDKESYLLESLDAADGNYLDETGVQQARSLAYPDPAFLNLPYWDKMGWLR